MRHAFGTIVTMGMIAFVCLSNVSAGVIWYTSEPTGNGSWSHLYSIDTASKAITDRGEIQSQRYITDLAAGADGTLYGVGWTNPYAIGSSKLYRITPGSAGVAANWDIVPVQSSAMDRTVNAAVMKGGDLYVASNAGALQKLIYDDAYDRWQVARTASMGLPSGGDLAFSAGGQKLYATLDGGRLGSVNFDESSANFGKVSIIGATGYSEVFGLAQVDGELYGFTNDNTNYGSSYMVKLNPLTGAASDPVALGAAVWGAAAGDVAGNPIPEPMTWTLLAVGGVLALARRRAVRQIASSC